MRAEKKSNFSMKKSTAEAEFRYGKGVGRKEELGCRKKRGGKRKESKEN